MSALKRTTEVRHFVDPREPSNNGKTPGKIDFEPVTLEHGVSYDPDFADWARRPAAAGQSDAPPELRRELSIQVLDALGRTLMHIRFYGAWVSEIAEASEADAAQGIAFESLKLEHEGFEPESANG